MSYLLWNHIVGLRFQLVLEHGILLPTTEVPDWCEPCAAILFGRDRIWETKADQPWTGTPPEKVYRSNRQEAADANGGLGRIGVCSDIAPYSTWEYTHLIGKSLFDHSCYWLEFGGHPIDYRISVDSVPSTNWQAVQVWQDGTWIDVPFEKHDC
jgi:hypothetical protein